jgi:NCAIR mutase (PurE)-related protein
VKDVLRRLVEGELTEEEALVELRAIQLEELGGRARLDLGRWLRRGIPEVVLAAGKTPADAARLTVAMAERHGQGLISRMSPAHAAAMAAAADASGLEVLDYYGASARVVQPGYAPVSIDARAGVLTAGTSDLPIANEARMVLESAGVEVRLEADLGVAGLHRFVAPLADILEWGADVLVVAAGMDGVLPGLVAGLVALPVIGLPVSTGYGRGGAGEAALLTMLQSCSTGLSVVNIDNGVGAGTAAVLIAARAAGARSAGGGDSAISGGAVARERSRPRTRSRRR